MCVKIIKDLIYKPWFPLIIPAMSIIFGISYLFSDIGVSSILIGLGIIFTSLFFLFYKQNEFIKKGDTSINITILKSAYTLVIAGLVMVFLGFLYLMRVIPSFR